MLFYPIQYGGSRNVRKIFSYTGSRFRNQQAEACGAVAEAPSASPSAKRRLLLVGFPTYVYQGTANTIIKEPDGEKLLV